MGDREPGGGVEGGARGQGQGENNQMRSRKWGMRASWAKRLEAEGEN